MMRGKLMTKALAVIATLAMTGTMAACGGDDKAAVDANGRPIVTVLVVKDTNMDKMENMQWARDLADDAGVTIQWQEVNDDQWSQQKNPSMSGGELADISIRAFSPDDAAQFPSLFEDFSQDMDKLPNVAKFFQEQPDAKKLVTDPEGHIYNLPSSRGKAYSGTGQNMLINKTWLDKLGLGMPTTWDEFENVLKAFKEKDPNGNGQADEIPFNIRALGTSNFGWYSPMLLLNSTGIATGFNKGATTTGYYAENGTVKSFLVSDQYKQVIKFYNKLINEGLIPAEWSTKDVDAYYADQTNDGKTAKTGVIFGWSPLTDFGDLRDQYVAMQVPAAPGVSADKITWDASSNEFEDYKLSIASAARNKDAALKVANLLYSEKYSIQQIGGSFGDTVTDDGNHTYTFDTAKMHQQEKDNLVDGLHNRLAGWIPDEVTIKGDDKADDIAAVNKVSEPLLKNFDHVKDFIPTYVRPDATDATTLSNNNTQILNTALQQTAQWMAKGGIDEGWDAYVQQLNNLGLQDNIKIWQKWYDTYTK